MRFTLYLICTISVIIKATTMSKRKVQKVMRHDLIYNPTMSQDPIGEKGLRILARMIAHLILANYSESTDKPAAKSSHEAQV